MSNMSKVWRLIREFTINSNHIGVAVSDFINNGELYKLLSTYQQLPIELAKLYIAQLALALGK